MLHQNLLSLRALACAAAMAASACRGPEPDFYLQSVIAIAGDRPALAVQWDSSELRHPRVDFYSFDGSNLVADYGMTLGQLRPTTVIAAASEPSRVIVQQDRAGTIFATGPDGFVLSNAFALRALSPIRGGFVGLSNEHDPMAPAATTAAVIVSVDERGRDRWRAPQTPGAPLCKLHSLLTPDGSRVAILVSDPQRSCVGRTTLRVYNDQGALVAEHPREPTTDASLGAPTHVTAATRDDLATLSIVQRTMGSEVRGEAVFQRAGDPSAVRFTLGGFVASVVAPVGGALWLLAGENRVTVERRSGSSTYRTVQSTHEARVLDDNGALHHLVTLANRQIPLFNVVATPRGTLLLTADSANGRPRWIVFSPDGRVARDEKLDLEARAVMVQPPLDASSP